MSERESSNKRELIAEMHQVRPLVAVLIIFFAMSAWMGSYGVGVEVPILVHILPEAWTLPSYLNFIRQLAIIISLIYAFLSNCCAGKTLKQEVIITYIIMGVGLTGLVLLIFFWDNTIWMAGAERSVVILSLYLFITLVGTTSKVVFYPYMARFPDYYMPAFTAGEDFGGLVSGIVGIIQGVGGESFCYNHTQWIYNQTTGKNYTESNLKVSKAEPLFSVSEYFSILALLFLTPKISFTILNFAPFSKREMVGDLEPETTNDRVTEDIALNNIYVVNAEVKQRDKHPDRLKKSEDYICLLYLLLDAFLINGLIFAIQAYSILPYGALTYTLAVRVSTLCSPLSSLLVYLIAVQSIRGLGVLTGVTTILVMYHLILATLSPTPPLTDNAIGALLSSSSFVVSQGLFSYSRSCIATLLSQRDGHRGLFLCGVALQTGTLIGGVLGFVLVSVLQTFESLPPCYEQ